VSESVPSSASIQERSRQSGPVSVWPAAAATPTGRAASSRVTGLDAARVLATFGVVWVHTLEIQGQDPAINTLGRFGTSFYALAAVFLAARSLLNRATTQPLDVIRRRAKRLLIPFALWCAIYAAFYFSTMMPQGHPIAAITRYWGPLFGTAPHLWFLPFAFMCGVLTAVSVRSLQRLPGWALWCLGLSLTLGLYVYVYGWGYAALDQPAITRSRVHRLARWTEEAPMVVGAIFGVALYGKYLPRLSRFGRRNRRRLAWVCLVGFVATQTCYFAFLDDLGSIFWNRVRFFSNIAGAFWLVLFVAERKNRWIQKMAPLGAATYFAYLSHQLILDAVKTQLKSVPGYGSLWFAVLSAIGIFALAVGLGLLVRRVRLLRFLSP